MSTEESWQKILQFMAILISVIALVFILRTLKDIFIPIVLAVFLSYLFAPVTERLAKIKIPRVLSLLLILAVITVSGRYFVQILINNTREFIAFYPTLESQALQTLSRWLQQYFHMEAPNLTSFMQSARVQELLSSSVKFSFSMLGKFLLTLLILLFIYLTYGNYPKLIRKAFGKDSRRLGDIFEMIRNINLQITQYFIVKTVISLGTGILTGTACAILGIKFAALWGFLAFLFNYIPYVGSIIAVILPIILSVLQFPNSYKPFVAGGTLIGIQLFMGNYLDPEMMGNRFNLSPIIIIFSLFFWGYVWGVVGTFLAVPITATIKIVISNIGPLQPVAVLMSKRAD
jgi:predicted PurR-regulated permease PerM